MKMNDRLYPVYGEPGFFRSESGKVVAIKDCTSTPAIQGSLPPGVDMEPATEPAVAPAPPTPKFQVGDRVVHRENWYRVGLGEVRTIISMEPPRGDESQVRVSGTDEKFLTSFLSPAPATEPPTPKFEIGDRVVTGGCGFGVIVERWTAAFGWLVALESSGGVHPFYEHDLKPAPNRVEALSPSNETSIVRYPGRVAEPPITESKTRFAPPPASKRKVGDRVRFICRCTKSMGCVVQGLLATVTHSFMRRDDEEQDYSIKADNGAEVAQIRESLLEPEHSRYEISRLGGDNINSWGKDLAGIVPCLRCGGPAGYLGIRCERVGGCRTTEERVPEPIIGRADAEGRVWPLGADIVPGNYRKTLCAPAEACWMFREDWSKRYATVELAVAAWKAGH